MKSIATLVLAVFMLTAQADGFKEAMGAALKEFSQCNTVADYTRAANTFQRIANAEKKEWLPLYYHSMSYIMMGFRESLEKDQRDAYLDVAQTSIDEMILIAEEESEIYALQSLLHTARLVVDPMNRGQQMMLKSGEAINKALELNPKNPRAQYMLLSNEVGMAQFFGKDVTAYCERINQLNNQWDELNKGPEMYPVWGKGEVEGLVQKCK